MTFQGYDVRSADLLKYLYWYNLALKRDKHLSLLMYDTINHNVPKYLSDVFSKCSEGNSCKSRLRESDLNVTMNYIPNTECYKGSFSYRGAKLWNSLSSDIKSSKSKAILKRKLSSGKRTVE